MAIFQGNVIKMLTKYNITLAVKRALNFERGQYGASKREKSCWLPPAKICFLDFLKGMRPNVEGIEY